MKRAFLAAMQFALLPLALQAQEATGIKAYSKFDFVPGAKIVANHDFMGDAIGDLPAGWDTNAAAEVVTIEGKPGRWLMLTRGGAFVPEMGSSLPDNFTLEFDLVASKPFEGSVMFSTSLTEWEDGMNLANWGTGNNRFTFAVNTQGSSEFERRQDGNGEAGNQVEGAPWSDKNDGVLHVSVWRQKERVRVYFNDVKQFDVPKAVLPTAKLNRILFYVQDAGPDFRYFVGNIRLAVGAPDTRNKLVTEGKFVTHGIKFDVNSDRIRGESYGTLKDIAAVLKESADIKVKIVGHTDSDGDAAANLDLSKRRAASVKEALISEFGIEAARMVTDGLGETQPAEPNNTPAGKASNRRVEFIKM